MSSDRQPSLGGTPSHAHLTDADVLEHFAQRGTVLDYQGRGVFLFSAGRDFGSYRHMLQFHGTQSPRVPEHIYSYAMITYVCSGAFSMRVANVPVELSQGECVVLDRHVPHAVEPTGTDDVVVNLIFSDEFFDEEITQALSSLDCDFATHLALQGASHDEWRVYRSAADETARDLVDRILLENAQPDAASGYIEEFLLAALLMHLLRTYEPRGAVDEALLAQSRLIGTVRAYLEQHYREGNLAEMARDLGYERTYLSKAIRAGSGHTFKQLVNAERMRRAALLLRSSDQPVYEVAQAVGLSNLTAFYQRFREWAGCTPKEYREKAG